MTNVLQRVADTYHYILEKDSNPEVNSWAFMSNPVPLLGLLAVYLYFILKLGPEYMQNRKPYNLKYVMIAYNLTQVVYNAWYVWQLFSRGTLRHSVTDACHLKGPNIRTDVAELAWWYFFSKIIDLFDTVFFVLRKKQNQVSFLHVYHHSGMILFAWVYVRILLAPQAAFIAWLNSAVHVVMYFYYFMSALGPNFQKYLFWKKYMTKIQLFQFCLILLYICTLSFMGCDMPIAMTAFFAGNTSIFLILFLNFYRQAYKKKLS